MRESQIEAHLVKRVKQLGGEVRKVRWLDRNGAPDRLVMLPGFDSGLDYRNNRTIWVELKAEGLGSSFPATPRERAQAREHERMRKMGQRVVVIDSVEGVEALLS